MKTKSLNHYFTLTSVILGFAATSGSLSAEDALTETFVAGERLTQDLSSTSAWYSSYNAQASDSTGDLVVDAGDYVISYFTDSGSSLTLGSIGDSITASVTFSIDTPVDNTFGVFRIALLDSNDTRISADGAGYSNSAFNDDTGYGAFLNLNASSAMKIYERDVVDDQLINGNNAWTSLTSENLGTGETFSGDYTLDITLLLTVDGVEISVDLSGVTGYTGTVTDTTDLQTAFDSIVIYGASSAMESFTLKDVTVSSIPEPSAAALMMGATALLLVLRRRC
jgi:hypothetical protein